MAERPAVKASTARRSSSPTDFTRSWSGALDRAQIDRERPAAHGGQQAVGRGREQQEVARRRARRLLEDLEQDVGRLVRQRLGVDHDEHLAARLEGVELGRPQDLTRGVGRGHGAQVLPEEVKVGVKAPASP